MRVANMQSDLRAPRVHVNDVCHSWTAYYLASYVAVTIPAAATAFYAKLISGTAGTARTRLLPRL